MQNLFLKSILVLILAICSTVVNARAPINKWFVGGDISYNNISYKNNLTVPIVAGGTLTYLLDDTSHGFTGIGLFAGYRWTKFGFEFGYDILPSFNFYPNNVSIGGLTNANAQLKQDNAVLYFDVTYNACLFKDLELKALVGVGSLINKFHSNFSYTLLFVSGSSTSTTTETKAGLRLGIGLQYNFSPDWSTSLMYKYQQGNNIVRDLQSGVLSIAYHA